MYHEVTDNPEDSGFDRLSALPYKHGKEEFELHLDQINSAAAEVCLADTIDFSAARNHILLTFDDGGKSAMHIADSIEKRSWRGHFFITTAMLNTDHFLSKKDIVELHSRGHIIGSHSHTHPDIFFTLSRAQMMEEWRISCRILSDLLSREITMASIPGGDMNMMAVETAYEAGIRYLFTSEPTTQPWSYNELLCIGRVCPRKGTPAENVKSIAEFRGFAKLMFIRRVKQQVKKILFPYYKRRIKRGMAGSRQ